MEDNTIIAEEKKTTKCLNCGTEFQGKFCPECGQKADTGRFTIRFIFQNFILGILSNDGGVWFTIKNLFTRPGQMMIDIINGKRKSYFSPFPMLFLTLSLYIIIFSFTGSKIKVYEKVFSEDDVTEVIEFDDSVSTDLREARLDYVRHNVRWLIRFYDNNYTIIFIITIPFYIFSARICFGKNNRKKYYRGEYCIPIIYSLIMVVLYQCLTSISFYFSESVFDFMEDLKMWVTIAAFTLCFKKMMGFSYLKMAWRSFLTYVFYFGIMAFLILCVIIFYAVYVEAFV